MRKLFIIPVIIFSLLLFGCYDSGEIEEAAYLIALGLDTGEDGYDYTFQFALPKGSASGGEEEKSENSAVKNIVISAPDFYTAKNLLANYLSKTLNMSHLKLIVCSWDFAKEDLKKHAGLFAREREIRPGTKMAVSEEKAEQFLKSVNPDLEGSTSKYYELSNSEKTLLYAPVMRLGDFVSEMKTFDKSSVLPIAEIDEGKKGTQLFGMGIFKDGKLKGKMSGEEAKLFNILAGEEMRFTFSAEDKKNSGKMLPFDVYVLKKPDFKFIDETKKFKIFADLYINIEYIGDSIPNGYKNSEEVLKVGENALKDNLTDFLYKASKDFSADILKLERFYKINMLTIKQADEMNFKNKYSKADFFVNIKRSNEAGNTVTDEIN